MNIWAANVFLRNTAGFVGWLGTGAAFPNGTSTYPTNNMSENPFSEKPVSTPSPSAAASDLRSAADDFAKATGETATNVKDRALETGNALKATAIEKADHYKTVASEKAEHYKTVATEKANQAKANAQQQWGETQVKAKEMHVTAEDYIRQNPTKTVLGALGVGFLIGLITRR
jgi:ElaB/YqjD/DUF883 family membrane-anchored ribosome-binding protein